MSKEHRRSMSGAGDQAVGIGRRSFLSGAIGAIGSALGLAYFGTALRFLYPTPAHRAEMQNVGRPEDFPSGKPRLVPYTGAGVTTGVYVLRQDDRWVAYDVHCTHLECPVTWYEATGEFLCPCHGSSFSLSGTNLSGPAPRPLRRHVVEVRSDGVYVGGLTS